MAIIKPIVLIFFICLGIHATEISRQDFESLPAGVSYLEYCERNPGPKTIGEETLRSLLADRSPCAFLGVAIAYSEDSVKKSDILPLKCTEALIVNLKNAEFHNDWGIVLPGTNTVAGPLNRLIAMSDPEAAIKMLVPLLSDHRVVKLSGSEPAALATKYHPLVCDYAFVLIASILVGKVEVPKDRLEFSAKIDKLALLMK